MSRPLLARLRAGLEDLWRIDAPLTVVAVLMLPVLGASILGLWLDPRAIQGAPAWLKPAKFAASIAIYALTLVWVFGHLPRHLRLRRVVGRVSALAFMVEIVIICLQAARGTRSHFNISTPLDGVLFAVMGGFILAQTLAAGAVAVALWREKLADRALGWAFRLGLTLSIAGAALGGVMTQPTEEQLTEMRAGRLVASGAHTVGASDGGPGLAVTGWSREHGDLRVPHFLGLHAFQALPLLALASRRRRWSSEAQRLRMILAAAVSYGASFALLLWQALREQPLLVPDALTTAGLLAWAALTVGLTALALRWPSARGDTAQTATLRGAARARGSARRGSPWRVF